MGLPVWFAAVEEGVMTSPDWAGHGAIPAKPIAAHITALLADRRTRPPVLLPLRYCVQRR
jgi:hypothetical protein